MPKPNIYLETTVISYLTAWTSRDIIREGHRQLTRAWWDHHRQKYDLFISQVVLDEIARGDPTAAADRIAVTQDIPLLPINPSIDALAQELVQQHSLPPRALQDAYHIATAAIHGIDILLTWNCNHIANPHILQKVRRQLTASNLAVPEIATPEALLGEENDA